MEIEAKYSVLDPQTREALVNLSHLAGFRVQESEVRWIQDTYLDTPDQRLMAAGYACRCRHYGDQAHINLKGLGMSDGTVHRREEVAIAIDETTLTRPNAWPESTARSIVSDLGNNQDLHILFEIHQQRHIGYLTDPGRTRIAEVSVDDVTFQGDNWQRQTTELEIELLREGGEDDLDRAIRALSEWPGLVPQPTSKFERGMGLAHRHHKIGATLDLGNVQPDDTVGEATRKLLRPLFLRMQIHEQGTYQGKDPEELHDMRVMIRRMRTAFRMAEPYLLLEDMGDIRKGLRQTARLLGAVRDMDVFRQKTEQLAGTVNIPLDTLSMLTEVWNVEYARRRNAMLDHLNSRKYGRFKQAFWTKLTTGLPDRDSPEPIRDVVHRIVLDQLDTLLTQGQTCEQPGAPLSAYHRLRIDVKHLRYTLSFFRELLGPETAAALEVLETLQDYLGDLQDAVVAVAHLHAAIEHGTWEMPQQTDLLWREYALRSRPTAAQDGPQRVLDARRAEIDILLGGATEIWHTFYEKNVPGLIRTAVKSL